MNTINNAYYKKFINEMAHTSNTSFVYFEKDLKKLIIVSVYPNFDSLDGRYIPTYSVGMENLKSFSLVFGKSETDSIVISRPMTKQYEAMLHGVLTGEHKVMLVLTDETYTQLDIRQILHIDEEKQLLQRELSNLFLTLN